MYYQPDPIWKVHNVNSKEDFIDKYVVKGNFHNDVHEDVVKSYSVAEHILALSYYHYPMYDVALNKLLGIFEMAIKLRCEQVGIELYTVNSKGSESKKPLSKLISQLLETNLIDEFENVLDNTRSLRNFSAHPEKHFYFGSLCQPVLITLVNLLNNLYLPKNHHLASREVFEKTKNELEIFELNLFIIENEKQRVLVYKPQVLETFKLGNDWVNAVSFQPVFNNTKEMLSQQIVPNGVVRFLSAIIVDEKGISANDADSNQPILIERTTDDRNTTIFKKHLDDLSELESMDLFSFESSMKSFCNQKTENFIHQKCWI